VTRAEIRALRWGAFVASLGILVAALLIVPLPLLLLQPGPAIDVPSHLKLAHAVDRPEGKLMLTTVNVSEPSVVEAAIAWLRPHREFFVREDVVPTGVGHDEYQRAQLEMFSESVRVAAAVGLREAGEEVDVRGNGVRVLSVLDGSPADGKLRAGDVIRSVNGRAVDLASDLSAITSAGKVGDDMSIVIRRDGTQRSVTLELGQLSSGRPGIGVSIETVDPKIELPFDVGFTESDIGGPSAGLMLALSVYDLLEPGDLTRGRTIAGTGTIDIAGNVGPIGGIQEKVIGARRKGATLFLAPASEAADARAAAPKGLTVVGVKTFQDAVDALKTK
jgi:PDZ domain-containing protein